MRLVRENLATEAAAEQAPDLEALQSDVNGDDDKTFAAMGVTKTLNTVGSRRSLPLRPYLNNIA